MPHAVADPSRIHPLGFWRVQIVERAGTLQYYAGPYMLYPGQPIHFAKDGDSTPAHGVLRSRTETVRIGDGHGTLFERERLSIDVGKKGAYIILSEDHGVHLVGKPVDQY